MPANPLTLIVLFLCLPACGSDSPTYPDPSGESEVFNVIGTMTTTRFFHTSTLLNDGRVLITGGYETDRPGHSSPEFRHATAELFDPVTGVFAPSGDTGLSSIDSAYLLPTGKVFLLSGRDVAIYDPSTGTANRTGHSIGQNRLLYTITPLKDGRIMVSGGLEDLLSTDEVLVYRP